MRRTPCIGICSTTYGDLVCRGCKRFAHEIVDWNRYEQQQRDRVWTRLHGLLAACVRTYLVIADEDRLRAIARDARVPDATAAPAEIVAFHAMRYRPLPLPALGLAARPHQGDGSAQDAAAVDTRSIVDAIDREFYLRSRAHYEASFKTLT